MLKIRIIDFFLNRLHFLFVIRLLYLHYVSASESPLYDGYRVFPGGKVLPGRAADHSPPSSAVVMKG